LEATECRKEFQQKTSINITSPIENENKMEMKMTTAH
jgi:hypothetical protein